MTGQQQRLTFSYKWPHGQLWR